jgi:hypothetical protein
VKEEKKPKKEKKMNIKRAAFLAFLIGGVLSTDTDAASVKKDIAKKFSRITDLLLQAINISSTYIQANIQFYRKWW